MIIYKTTNLINGKIYIGKHTGKDLNYLGSGNLFFKALKKYGKENFKKEILEQCETLKQLNEREIYWIEFFKSNDLKIGYNLSKGGEGSGKGWKMSEEGKQKIIERKTGLKFSEESKKKIGKSNLGKSRNKGISKPKDFGEKRSNFLKNRTEEQKKITNKKISDSQQGKPKPKPKGFGEKISKANIGIPKHTEESKHKISIKRIGIKLTEETKNKIREKKRGHIDSEETKQKRNKSLCKPILQFDLNWNFIKEWPSQIEVLRTLHIDLSSCLKNRAKSAGNYKWKYKNE
jgi:group I intron endonuclease